MSRAGRKGESEDVFEILVTAYAQKSGALTTEGELCWSPATDVYETDETFVVQMDLAGMEPSRIEVVCDGRLLLVRGVRTESAGPGRKHFHIMEINVGPFVRRVPLPPDVDPDSAAANYRGGFLYVTFRRGMPRRMGRRQIDVDR